PVEPHGPHRPVTGATTKSRPTRLADPTLPALYPELAGHGMTAHMDDHPLVWKATRDRHDYAQDDAAACTERGCVRPDRGRLWLRSEGERRHGRTETGVEALGGKPMDAWWDLLAGVRQAGGDGPGRDWLALGVQGLAPYKFELSATAYLGDGGRGMLKA